MEARLRQSRSPFGGSQLAYANWECTKHSSTFEVHICARSGVLSMRQHHTSVTVRVCGLGFRVSRLKVER